VPPELVLPVFVSVIFFFALLIGYPWHILSAGSILYLLSLPLGWKSYRDQKRAYEAVNATASAAATPPAAPPSLTVVESSQEDRLGRLH